MNIVKKKAPGKVGSQDTADRNAQNFKFTDNIDIKTQFNQSFCPSGNDTVDQSQNGDKTSVFKSFGPTIQCNNRN